MLPDSSMFGMADDAAADAILHDLVHDALGSEWLALEAPPVAAAGERLSQRIDALALPDRKLAEGDPRFGGKTPRSGMGFGDRGQWENPSSRKESSWGKTLGAAIAGIIVLVVIAFGRYPTADTRPELVKTYATTVGERASIVLEDGTHVTLAPRSTLGVTRGFGQHTRTVTLTGEAIFDVPAASGVPFLVHTGTITTRVLGTRFDVRRYDTDTRTRVAVLSGKVIVTGRVRAKLALAAGTAGDVTDSTAAVLPQDAAAQVTSWNDGMLVFHDAPAHTVLDELSHWYGYEFQLADPALATKNVTARFRIGSSSSALAHLKLLLDVDLAFDGKIVTLRQRHPGGKFPDGELGHDRREAQDTFNFTQSEAGR